jgi:hypothetical protein
MGLMDTKYQKKEKIKKPLTGIQVVATILGVRTDSVSRVITGQTLCTPERVQMYKDELKLVDELLNQYIIDRKRSLIDQNKIS